MRHSFAATVGLCLLGLAGVVLADGLDANYGKDLPSVQIKGKEFKILRKGKLDPGKALVLNKVVYEKNAKAIAVAFGKGEGSDFDILVKDANGKEIGKDVLLDNVPVVEWNTGDDRNVVDIILINSGKQGGDYVLLANW